MVRRRRRKLAKAKKKGDAIPEEPAHRKLKCPSCKKVITVRRDASTITCQHCGKSGKPPGAGRKKSGKGPGYKKVRCPSCRRVIEIRAGRKRIKCRYCGKVGHL
jgi:LSD1 subclass zinc finger protein